MKTAKNKRINSRMEIARGIKEKQSGIDRKFEDNNFRGLIHGVAVMTKGNVKDDRGWEIDDVTLDQIVTAGNAHKFGLKSRFGHPNMSGTALGTFLGRAKNFSRDGDIARADLYISKTAYETPNGDLASYVLNLAENDPDSFGTSVVLGESELEDNKNIPKKDKKNSDLPPVLRIKSLLTVDVVDDPAANNGMFGKFFNESVELSAKATEFLDNLLNKQDAIETVISFLERYRVNRAEAAPEKFLCECIVCGYQMESEEHCNNIKCPECGGQMRRASRPGPGQEGQQKKQEVGEMGIEIKDLTVEILKKERPEIIQEMETAAVKKERDRATGIVEGATKEFSGMGMEDLLVSSVKDGKSLDTTLAEMRKKRLEDIEKGAAGGPGPDDKGTPLKKTHLEKAQEYQLEHKCSIADALRATAEPRKE